MATIEQLRGDADLLDTLGELYAGDGRTYAEELRAVRTWSDAWRVLVGAASVARMSGDYVAGENIRELVASGVYTAELAAGRAIYKGERA